MGLNENQRRAISVTLRLLEERLVDIEQVMNGNAQGILYRRTARFTSQQRKEMRKLIAAMREEIRRAATQFHLAVEEQSAERYISGKLSMSWESLEDTRSRKLKAYGEVDPALKETLDPILQRLIDLLFTLEDATRGKSSIE